MACRTLTAVMLSRLMRAEHYYIALDGKRYQRFAIGWRLGVCRYLWQDPPPMVARVPWPLSTAAAVSLLVASLTVSRASREQEPRFDEPAAAARHDLERRRPADAGLEMPRLYDAAARQVASLSRFASRIDRALPAALPPHVCGCRIALAVRHWSEPNIAPAFSTHGHRSAPATSAAARASCAPTRPCPPRCLPPACLAASGGATTTA